MPPPRCGKLAVRLKHPRRDHGHDQVTRPGGTGVEELWEAEAFHGLQHGVRMAVVTRAHDLDNLRDRGEFLALEHTA